MAITADTFPDAAFRQWLTDPANLDGAGADSLFTAEEIAQIREINVSGRGISSLEGIQIFTALDSLSCMNNSLYAQWQANTYTVTFHANGGGGSMEDQSFTYGTSKAVSAWEDAHGTAIAQAGGKTLTEANAQTVLSGAQAALGGITPAFVAEHTDLTALADQERIAALAGGRITGTLQRLTALSDAAAEPEQPEQPDTWENPYTDVADGAWYADAVAWACGTGLVTGVTGETLEPAGGATRAQTAVLLMRFCENIEEKGA